MAVSDAETTELWDATDTTVAAGRRLWSTKTFSHHLELRNHDRRLVGIGRGATSEWLTAIGASITGIHDPGVHPASRNPFARPRR